MRRRDLLRSLPMVAGAGRVGLRLPMATGQSAARAESEDGVTQRAAWLAMLDKVCRPVLSALATGTLRATMPVESAAGHDADRRRVTHLEAVARTLCGIAPWLEHGPGDGNEGKLRRQYSEWAVAGIAHGVDPHSADYLNFGQDRQTIVDAAFLGLALARAPRQLRDALPKAVRAQLAEGLRATRRLLPGFNNWLLFAGMIEVCLFQLGEPYDRMRIDYALREHASWYLGDGTYGDGPQFHADYYNSFVIHPFLVAIVEAAGTLEPAWNAMRQEIMVRARRYADLQERAISPEGTYPIVGRSIAYRCGAFHLLADSALRGVLPEGVSAAQVRCALTAVMQRTLGAAGTFDERGWLQIGLAGHQAALGETYISTGSLYLCTAAFLPLGLAPESAFWSAPAQPWSSRRAWSGENLRADHAL